MLRRAAVCALIWLLAPSGAFAEGVTLLRPEPGSALAAAGLTAGDVVTAWRAPGSPEGGPVDSPFELFRVATEHTHSGPVTLTVLRDGASRAVEIPPGHWLADVHPRVDPAERGAFDTALAALDDAATRADGRARLAGLIDRAGTPATRIWYRHRLAGSLRRAGLDAEADAQVEAALAEARTAGLDYAAGWLAQMTGIECFQRQQPEAGQRWLLRALDVWREALPGSLSEANTLNNLAIAASIRSDFAGTRRFAGEALAIQQAVTGRSLAVARTHHTLGNAAFWSDDLEAAEAHFDEALDIRRELAPGGLAEAQTLSVLGNVAWRRGLLDRAAELKQQTLDKYRALGVESFLLGELYIDLGNLAHDRFDLAAAERHRLEALAVFRETAPEGTQVADALLGLGNVERQRGDADAARGYYERALGEYRRIQPGGQREALVRQQLGELAREAGDLEAAAGHYRASLATLEALGARGPLLASRHRALGVLHRERGELETARGYLERALDGFAEASERTLNVAAVRVELGRLALAEGDPVLAEEALSGALAVAAGLAPGTVHEAAPAHELARLLRRQGRVDEALALHERAVTALESQRVLIGGSDRGRVSFEARYGDYYRDYLDLLLQVGRTGAAFDVLERHRARAMMSLLAARGPRTADLPPGLAGRWQAAARAYEQALEAASGTGPDAAAATARLPRLRSEREQVEREAAARRDGAARPAGPPAGFADVAAALPADTALLSYAVLEARTVVFVVPAGAPDARRLSTFEVDVGRRDLAERVQRFLLLMQLPDAGEEVTVALEEASRALYADLLGAAPAAAALAGARRLVLVPDGPLHRLPFAALRDPAGRYLVERLPLASALSATLLLTTPAGAAGSGGAAARFTGPALPSAAAELDAVAGRFPGALVLTGEAAAESRVKALAGPLRLLHFATHAVADERWPLDGFLELAGAADADDGLLRAWEVAEQMRLDADLVVLSTCRTGLGREMSGEGMIGLTRAFQLAGARRVLASLWSVSDASTASLMTRFYAGVAAGDDLAAALRRAQLALIGGGGGPADWLRSLGGRSPVFSHPYYWGGFQLNGSAAPLAAGGRDGGRRSADLSGGR